MNGNEAGKKKKKDREEKLVSIQIRLRPWDRLRAIEFARDEYFFTV